ncbi:F-box protein At2g27310-like [Neltuma alba]|uniref:F-box protein At2g27310-like n=1 Tax=Neltuma alba TaxID=207710 RepID=UPI0010A501A5|nr:F-box protein At2g27310-like [Prosopis alba]
MRIKSERALVTGRTGITIRSDLPWLVQRQFPLTDGGTAATSILTLHPSIIQTHILTRLDVSALASVATTCSQLHAIVSQEDFWANLCHSTWPSTSSPSIRHVIRRFPHGSRSFFHDSATIPRPNTTIPRNSHINLDRTPQLISAVDLYHRRQLLLSRVVQTETVSDSFRCSPFRVDILEPEEVVQTHIRYPESDEAYRELMRGLRMSWILIDASGGRAMTVSSRTPIGLLQSWQSGTAEFWFMSVMTSNEEPLSKLKVCRLTVRCVEAVGGETEVREVSLEMEGIDGRTKLMGGRVW